MLRWRCGNNTEVEVIKAHPKGGRVPSTTGVQPARRAPPEPYAEHKKRHTQQHRQIRRMSLNPCSFLRVCCLCPSAVVLGPSPARERRRRVLLLGRGRQGGTEGYSHHRYRRFTGGSGCWVRAYQYHRRGRFGEGQACYARRRSREAGRLL